MPEFDEVWLPGSFTKNYSWGPISNGFRMLHEAIRTGFDGKVEDIPRDKFRERVRGLGRADYIPINFFLFNKPIGKVNFLIADELVFQAVSFEHSVRFDKLALLTFCLSYAGKWRGARAGQRRPALWALNYVKDKVAKQFDWNIERVSAEDVAAFVDANPRYKAETSGKLSTNLAYQFQLGRLSEWKDEHVERWWVDGLFVALDRLIEDRLLDQEATPDHQFLSVLRGSDFLAIAGRRSLEKELAAGHLARLYAACGGRDRFSDERMREFKNVTVPEILGNMDPRPQGALHLTNPRILKSIPRICAMLAKDAGFDILDADELESFDLEKFVRRNTREAIRRLQKDGIKPTITADELMKLTRSR